MKNSFKKKFLVLFLILAMILTFSFVPAQKAYAWNPFDPFGIFDVVSGFIGSLLAAVVLTISPLAPGIALCFIGHIGPDWCRSEDDTLIVTPPTGVSGCQFAIPLTFYIPSFNIEPGLYNTLPSTPIDETRNKIAIYRFSLPDTLSPNDLAVTLIAGPGGDYGNGGGFANQFGSGWRGDAAVSYFTYSHPKSDSPQVGTFDYSEICKGNVCKVEDSKDVPPNSYIVYVAKILGDYTFPVDETVSVPDPISGGYMYAQVPTPTTLPNKFLTTKESAAFATLPSHYEHSPYDSWSFGDAYLGPFQTGVPVCDGACGSANGKTYAYSDTSYGSDTQCSSGTSTYSTFPSAGSSLVWICVGENGGSSSRICSASRSASITNDLTLTADLTADPNPVNYNSASMLSWTTQDAVGCWGYSETGKTWPGGDNYQAISGNVFTENLIANQTYNMDCWNSAGVDVIGSVTVTVIPPTNGLTLTAEPNPVNYNSASMLSWTWTTQDAVGCWGYSETGKTWPGGDNYQAISGNVFTENLTVDQTYYMDCWNSAGVDVFGSVTVTIPPSPTNPGHICAPDGKSATISWTPAPDWNVFYLRTQNPDPDSSVFYDDNNYISSSYTMNSIIPNQSYNWWVHSKAPNGAYSTNVGETFSCPPACAPDCSCKENICVGSTCSDGCRGICPGTLPPSCGSWGACNKSCGGGIQTKSCVCPNKTETLACNSQPCPPGYREVAPW